MRVTKAAEVDRLSLLDETLRAFDSSLPEVVTSRCVATRYRASTCRRCVDVCPAGAVSLDPLAVDADRCIACTACAAVCRTGALDYPRTKALVHDGLTDPRGGTAVVACSQADLKETELTPDVVVACLAGLSPADLVAAAAAGRDGLALLSGDCPSCAAAGAMAGVELAATPAMQWLTAIGRPLRLERVTTTSKGAPMRPPDAAVSRRDVFGLLMGRGRAVAAAALAPSMLRIEQLHAVTPPPAAHGRMLADLETLSARAGEALRQLPGDIPFAAVDIGDACNECGLCTSYCPHGALKMSDGGVVVQPRLCTGCGLCAEMCPREAVAVRPAAVVPQRR
jgi:ferredoxin